MKALFLVMGVSLLASSAHADSASLDEEPTYAWTLSVDPLTTALGFVHLQLERAIGTRFSLYAGPSLRLFTPPFLAEDDDRVRGYGVELGARVFFYGAAPEGAWVQVRGVIAYLRDDETDGVGGYVSLLAGYTWIYKRLVLGGGLGVQYLAYKLRGVGPSGFAPAAHTVIGVAF